MTEAIRDFFKSEKIEYYAVGAYSDFKETRPDIMERTGISGKSVIMYLLPYFTEEGENISSYAIPCDYHTEIDRINRSLIGVINAHEPEAKAVGFGVWSSSISASFWLKYIWKISSTWLSQVVST